MRNLINPAHQFIRSLTVASMPWSSGFTLVRQRLNQLEIQDETMAHFICQIIPAQCPFEREICLFGRTVGRIPPLCQLNPFYEEVVSLRFRALCYLADECGKDIGYYC